MKKLYNLTISAIASLVLVGCGDSGSSTSTGYFIDSGVRGAQYHTSSGLSGFTDSYGRFQYNTGDTVTFSLGNLILGETTPYTDGLITPEELIVGDATVPDENQTEAYTLMLQTLQSLDSDNDPTNGISISSDIISTLETNLTTSVNFRDINETYLLDLDHRLSLGLDEDNDGVIDINSSTALTHFQDSLNSWRDGRRPDQYATMGASSFDINNYPLTTDMTQELKDALAHMGNEERLAYDVYMNLYNYHLNNSTLITPLYNIATKSEDKHISIVQSIVQRYDISSDDLTDVNSTVVSTNNMSSSNMPSGVYDIEAIQNLYDELYSLGTTSNIDALKVGCMVEVVDINDLDHYIALAHDSNATDIEEAFNVLRAGSYNHYWAFDEALKDLGVTTGCVDTTYSELLTDKTDIYPQNDEDVDTGYRYRYRHF